MFFIGWNGVDRLETGGFEKGIIIALNGVNRISMLFEQFLQVILSNIMLLPVLVPLYFLRLLLLRAFQLIVRLFAAMTVRVVVQVIEVLFVFCLFGEGFLCLFFGDTLFAV